MGKFENKFLSLLKEDDIAGTAPPPPPAVAAAPEDDQQSFANALDEPENAGEFEDVIDQNPNEQLELSDLQEWIGNIMKYYNTLTAVSLVY